MSMKFQFQSHWGTATLLTCFKSHTFFHFSL